MREYGCKKEEEGEGEKGNGRTGRNRERLHGIDKTVEGDGKAVELKERLNSTQTRERERQVREEQKELVKLLCYVKEKTNKRKTLKKGTRKNKDWKE